YRNPRSRWRWNTGRARQWRPQRMRDPALTFRPALSRCGRRRRRRNRFRRQRLRSGRRPHFHRRLLGQLRNRLRRGLGGLRSLRPAISIRTAFGMAEYLAQPGRDVVVDRTGVGLLLGDAQLREPVQDLVGLDLKLTGQLVNPNLFYHQTYYLY